MKSLNRGLTLVELLTGLSILAVLTALAAPSINNWRTGARLTSYSNELSSSLAYARSEALKRGVRVTMCKSASPTAATPACTTTGDWSQGWIIFTDNIQVLGNVAGAVDGVDTVLKVWAPLPEVVITAINLNNWVSYLPSGISRTNSNLATETTFTLCMPNRSGVRIVLNSTGRARSAPWTSCP